MELNTMSFEELEARKAAIATECEAEGADLDALLEESRAINAEIEARKAAEAKKAELRSAVAAGAGTVIETAEAEERKDTKMDLAEIRKSDAYVNAFANYIKTEDDSECRALLSENTLNGTVPVPEVVYDIVKNAWEKDAIARRVRRAYLRGNLKVGFEISSDGAVLFTEGNASEIDPENLVLGIVELVPQSIKKVVQVSDEALDLAGEAFLRYLYDEITYQIAKKAVDTLLAKIVACTQTATTTCVNVGVVTATTVNVGIVSEALATLSDQAVDPIIVMNKQTWGAFKAAQIANKFNYDPFEGLPVAFNNSLPAFSAATTGVAWMIVGDFTEGAIFNFPNGEEIDIIVDRMSLKKKDLVEIFGRQFVGIGVVGPKSFAKVVK